MNPVDWAFRQDISATPASAPPAKPDFLTTLLDYANALDALDAAQDAMAMARDRAEALSHTERLSLHDAHIIYWGMPRVHAKWLAAATGHKSAHTFVLSCPPEPLDLDCPLCGAPVYASSRVELARLNNGRPRLCEDCSQDERAETAERWRAECRAHETRLRELRAMPYRDYLRTPEWDQRRRAAVKRARGACQVCNAKARLDVHHRTYARLGCEWATDLIALCRPCHGTFHANGRLAS